MRAVSLRARLVALMLVVLALGMAVAGAATYTLLRSSLIERVDTQLNAGGLLATRELFAGRGRFPFGPRLGRAAPQVAYAALLDATGTPLAERRFGFDQDGPAPDLPAGLPGSASAPFAERRLLTAGSGEGRYRVLAAPLPNRRGTAVVAVSLSDVDATLRRLVLLATVVGLTVLAVLGFLARRLVDLGMRPLTEMERAAEEIAGGDLSRRVGPSDERSEVGRLGMALNRMLERIEASFEQKRASEDRLRRFVADASHELRTPLTSIRGYAELFRMEAGRNPDAVETSMRRIEEEAARMGELVDELLLLARLDRGRALVLTEVDLAALAADAVEDLRATHPGHAVSLDAPAAVVVEGDEARLRQVLANLISNAAVHTPVGTSIRVEVRALDVGAHIVVADDGPGIDPEVAPEIFERFVRADRSRSRSSGGSGLGLAIVKAIAEAHGGSVTLDSGGSGARFTVELPAGQSGAGAVLSEIQ